MSETIIADDDLIIKDEEMNITSTLSHSLQEDFDASNIEFVEITDSDNLLKETSTYSNKMV